jgi:hypothetical protein
MVPERQAVSPFRQQASPSPSARVKAGRKQPYAFATPPRSEPKPLGDTMESPRFGTGKRGPQKKDKSRADEAFGNGAPDGIQIMQIVSPRDPDKPKKKKSSFLRAKPPEDPRKKQFGRQESEGYTGYGGLKRASTANIRSLDNAMELSGSHNVMTH